MTKKDNDSLQKIKIIRYEVVDSTNTRAREYAEEFGTCEPVAFVAKGQTAGRGRRGRSFDSENGAGLYISFLFKPENELFDISKITAFSAVKVCRALKRCCGIDAGIKWVNDIYVNDRKLAGILTEGEFSDDGKGLKYIVCGIGINTKKRLFPDEISGIAITVEEIIGKQTDNEALMDSLISEFFAESESMELIEEYRARSVLTGKDVEVSCLNGEKYSARVLGISDEAKLVVEKENKAICELISAEVSVKRK